MAKRVTIAKADRDSGPGAELMALCQRITVGGKLTEDGIKELIRWLRNNGSANLPAKDHLTEVMTKIVADRTVTRDEHQELYRAIESILPPDIRKTIVQQRKEVEAVRKERLKTAKAEQKQREMNERAQALAASGVVMLTGINGRQYKLETLIGRVEYGEETIAGLTKRLGSDIASVVEQHVSAR